MLTPDKFYQNSSNENVVPSTLSSSGEFRNDISNIYSKIYPLNLNLSTRRKLDNGAYNMKKIKKFKLEDFPKNDNDADLIIHDNDADLIIHDNDANLIIDDNDDDLIIDDNDANLIIDDNDADDEEDNNENDYRYEAYKNKYSSNNDYNFNFNADEFNEDILQYYSDNNDLIINEINNDVDKVNDNYNNSIDNNVKVNFVNGLFNIGNSCYMNSVLQTIFSFKFFMDDLEDFLSKLDQNDIEKLKISVAFIDLFTAYKTKSFIDKHLKILKYYLGQVAPGFQTNDQQDAGEYFTILLDNIKQEIEEHMPRISFDYNPVDNYFQHELSYEDICHNCDISSAAGYEKSRLILLKSRNDIQNAFLHFLNEESPLRCSNCNNKFLRRVTFEKFPRLLCFQINRYLSLNLKDPREITAPSFIYLPKNYIRYKDGRAPLFTPYRQVVESVYKKNLEATKRNLFSDDNENTIFEQANNINSDDDDEDDNDDDDADNFEIYQLLSVICHHGNFSQGHYMTYVFNFDEQKWFSCDDLKVSEVEFKTIQKDTLYDGYCYFYVHVTT